jgi:hypothetical protein
MQRYCVALSDGVAGRIAQTEELVETETVEIEFQAATDIAHSEHCGESQELPGWWLGHATGLRLCCAR